MRNIVAVCSLFLLLAAVPSARADNTACAGAVFVVPDGSVHEGSFTAAPQDRWFRFVAKANRSYALVAENLAPTDTQPFVGMAEPVGPACGGPFLTNTLANNQEPPTLNPGTGFGSARRTMVLAADSEVFFPVRRLAGGTPGAFRMRVEETTLFSPAWSSFGAFDTFYSFQNTTTGPIDGTLTLLSLAGAVVDTASATLAAGGTFSTNTSSMGTPRNQAGVAIFTHNGPPGSILCDASIASFSTTPPYIQAVKCQTARQQR